MASEIRTLVRELRRAGVRVVHTGGGHLSCSTPDGSKKVTFSSTPSDNRAIHAIRKDLKRNDIYPRPTVGKRKNERNPCGEGQDDQILAPASLCHEGTEVSGPEPLGEWIRQRRTAEGLTQKDLGQLLEVNRHTVWSWEHDKCRPTRETHFKLLDLFGDCERPKVPSSEEPDRSARDCEGLSPTQAVLKKLGDAGISKVEVARALQVCSLTVTNWEKGATPSKRNGEALGALLDSVTVQKHDREDDSIAPSGQSNSDSELVVVGANGPPKPSDCVDGPPSTSSSTDDEPAPLHAIRLLVSLKSGSQSTEVRELLGLLAANALAVDDVLTLWD